MTRLATISTTSLWLTATLSIGQDIIIKNSNVRFDNSKLTEKVIKSYLDNADNLDPIEGIWSFSTTIVINGASSKQDNYAKIAIIKDTVREDRDYMNVLLSATDQMLQSTGWYKYCVTGEFERTAYSNVYINKPYKRKTEIKNQPKSFNFYINESGLLRTSSSFWSEGIKIEEDDFGIRLYPDFITEARPRKSLEVSGSGFFLTIKGVVATSYHVIEDGKSISIEMLRDGKSETYNAKVLTADKSNDIALLLIDDKDFLALSSIPYSVANKAEIGESVFTCKFRCN